MSQDRAEGLGDDEVGAGEYPPEEPLGAEEYGTTARTGWPSTRPPPPAEEAAIHEAPEP